MKHLGCFPSRLASVRCLWKTTANSPTSFPVDNQKGKVSARCTLWEGGTGIQREAIICRKWKWRSTVAPINKRRKLEDVYHLISRHSTISSVQSIRSKICPPSKNTAAPNCFSFPLVCAISPFTNDCCSATSSQLCFLTSEWTLLTWECRFPLWENDAGQNMHRWGFSPVCLAMWVCSTTFWLKAFPQWLHLKGLSPGGKTSLFNLFHKIFFFFFFRTLPSVYTLFCCWLLHFLAHEKTKHRFLSNCLPE